MASELERHRGAVERGSNRVRNILYQGRGKQQQLRSTHEGAVQKNRERKAIAAAEKAAKQRNENKIARLQAKADAEYARRNANLINDYGKASLAKQAKNAETKKKRKNSYYERGLRKASGK